MLLVDDDYSGNIKTLVDATCLFKRCLLVSIGVLAVFVKDVACLLELLTCFFFVRHSLPTYHK